MKRKKFFSFWIQVLATIIGTGSFALGIHCFIAPNDIAPGGVSGIAIIVNHLTGIPIGTVSLLINLPLLCVAFKFLGKPFIIKSAFAIISFTIMIDYIFQKIPVYQGDKILAALFGGLLTGIGLALVFMIGSSTGGADIVAKLLQIRFPHISLGRLMLCFDMVVILASTFVYKNIETALYAIIAMFVTSKSIDGILYGQDVSKMLLIISEKNEVIAADILKDLGRGVTFLQGQGAYSQKQKQVILCAIRNSEFYTVKKIISQYDSDAFIMVSETNEVIGLGFKNAGSLHSPA